MTRVESGLDKPEANKSESKVLYLKPLGVQGPNIGIQISSRNDYIKLDEAYGKLTVDQKLTIEGVMKAVKESELKIVDF